jgi:hypothetical protein
MRLIITKRDTSQEVSLERDIVMKFILAKLEPLYKKNRQLRDWIQSKPLILSMGRCILLSIQIAILIQDAWARDVISIAIAVTATFFVIVPMLWEPPKGGGGWFWRRGNDNDDPSSGPDSPTGDSAERWLKARTGAKA